MDHAFSVAGHWYRGNLHMHTDQSDGQFPPAEAVAWYQKQGYDFVVLTDHRKTVDVDDLSTHDFLVIPGIELDCFDHERGASYHIVGIGVKPFNQPEVSRRGPGQNLVKQILDAGGQALLAHPYWLGQVISDLSYIEGAFGIEVYNTTCDRNGKAYGSVHWDLLLERGTKLWGVATDDTHLYDVDPGKGWVMVKAESLTDEAIMKSLSAGHFYASQGPVFLDVRTTPTEITVHTSPVKEMRFVSNGGSGQVIKAPSGETLSSVSQPLKNRKYVRVELVDANGKMAWSQPIFLD